MSHLVAVPDRPQRVVLYVRVSALMGRGGDDFHSPEMQVAAMRRATASMREVAVVDDIDVSGTTFSRRGLDRVRQLVEAGEVDAIAVYDLSRLGRNVLESLQFLKWINERGVTIVSACEQIDTSTPAGEMMLINMLSIAQYRSREIGRAWQQIINRRAARGRHHGRVPTGYRRDPDGRLEPDPATAAAVTAAFAAYAAGVAHREVRRRLQAATGLTLAAGTMKGLLANEVYRGVVRLRGGARVEDAHAPLVDEVTWQRVQRRIAAARTIPARYQSPRYSLSGIGRCRRCGHNTVIRPHHRYGATVYCRRGREGNSPCKGCGGMQLVDIEAAVLDQVAAYIGLLRGDVAAQEARLARAARAGVDAEMLERELAATRRAMVRLTERWARADDGDDAVYEEAMASLREAERSLLERLEQTRGMATGPGPGKVADLAEQLMRLWPDMDGSQRNRALRELVDHVVVAPAQYYRQPAAERVTAVWR